MCVKWNLCNTARVLASTTFSTHVCFQRKNLECGVSSVALKIVFLIQEESEFIHINTYFCSCFTNHTEPHLQTFLSCDFMHPSLHKPCARLFPKSPIK